MSRPFAALLLLFGLALSACAPEYTTTLTPIPPASGQMVSANACTTGCATMMDACKQNCALLNRQCADNDAFLNQPTWHHHDPFWNNAPQPVCYIEQCNATCNHAFISCQTGCGGQVKQVTTCTANCPKPVPQLAQ